MSTYLFRGIDAALWAAAQRRAASEGRSMRYVLLALVGEYATHGYDALVCAPPHTGIPTSDGHPAGQEQV